jgi:hypothetical protein
MLDYLGWPTDNLNNTLCSSPIVGTPGPGAWCHNHASHTVHYMRLEEYHKK